ncbi:hypothetical protein NW754_007398 [Fusarium falciforme]|nr:hypothetical protein NW754_007398 [Fusarium falciforme]
MPGEQQCARWAKGQGFSHFGAVVLRSIGDAFASLSKNEIELPRRFGQLKNQLIGDSGRAILDSWVRLLQHVEKETIPSVNEISSSIIPEVEFSSIVENGGQLPDKSKALLKERGTIVIRGLVSEKQALDWKQSVYELYWSKAQLEARAHQNMLLAQAALNCVWSKTDQDKAVLSEAPGDKSFNLGPHLDGGSLERWEDPEYRKCYTEILQGRWEEHDAFNGWLSLSDCAPTNGSLRVLPDLKASTAYTLLRPFVRPTPGGWDLDANSSFFHGAAMGAGQELLPNHHPHVSPSGFVTIPRMRPGDAVFWHCDAAHMVEKEHQGKQDASVFYIPAVPLCDVNAVHLQASAR